MKSFNQMPASEVVNRGTNPSCILNRKMICKAKEETVIGPEKNVVVIEKGEKIVCEYIECSSDFYFRFTSIEALKSRSASQLIDGSWFEVVSALPFEDFKNKFEVLDEETSQISPLFETVNKEVCSIRACRDKLNEAEYNIETTSNRISVLFCLVASIAGFITATATFHLCREIPDASASSIIPYAVAYSVAIFISFFGLVSAGLIFNEVIDSPVQFEKFSARVKVAKAEYDTVSGNSEQTVETFKKNMRWP